MLSLYGVVGALIGLMLTASVIVMGAGAFWLFIFGDDPWPPWAENGLVLASLALGVAVFAAALRLGWHHTRPQ